MEQYIPSHQDSTDPSATFSHHLDTVGFQVQHCEARNMTFEFSNVNQLVAAVKAVNPFVSRLPSVQMQMVYMRDLLSELKNMETPGMETGKAMAR